jgi:hypothetical protein
MSVGTRSVISPFHLPHFPQLPLNDEEAWGSQFVNSKWNSRINRTIIAVLFLLPLVLAAQVILGL